MQDSTPPSLSSLAHAIVVTLTTMAHSDKPHDPALLESQLQQQAEQFQAFFKRAKKFKLRPNQADNINLIFACAVHLQSRRKGVIEAIGSLAIMVTQALETDKLIFRQQANKHIRELRATCYRALLSYFTVLKYTEDYRQAEDVLFLLHRLMEQLPKSDNCQRDNQLIIYHGNLADLQLHKGLLMDAARNVKMTLSYVEGCFDRRVEGVVPGGLEVAWSATVLLLEKLLEQKEFSALLEIVNKLDALDRKLLGHARSAKGAHCAWYKDLKVENFRQHAVHGLSERMRQQLLANSLVNSSFGCVAVKGDKLTLGEYKRDADYFYRVLAIEFVAMNLKVATGRSSCLRLSGVFLIEPERICAAIRRAERCYQEHLSKQTARAKQSGSLSTTSAVLAAIDTARAPDRSEQADTAEKAVQTLPNTEPHSNRDHHTPGQSGPMGS